MNSDIIENYTHVHLCASILCSSLFRNKLWFSVFVCLTLQFQYIISMQLNLSDNLSKCEKILFVGTENFQALMCWIKTTIGEFSICSCYVPLGGYFIAHLGKLLLPDFCSAWFLLTILLLKEILLLKLLRQLMNPFNVVLSS